MGKSMRRNLITLCSLIVFSLACNKVTAPNESPKEHIQYKTEVVSWFPENHIDAQFTIKNRNLEFKINAIGDTTVTDNDQNFLVAIDYKNGKVISGESHNLAEIPLTENQKLYNVQFNRSENKVSIVPYTGNEDNWRLAERHDNGNSINHTYSSEDSVAHIQIKNAPVFEPRSDNVIPIGLATRYNSFEEIGLPADTVFGFKSGIYKLNGLDKSNQEFIFTEHAYESCKK